MASLALTIKSQPRYLLARALIASVLMMPAISACAPILSNTPVEGDRRSIARLVGQWEGTYDSPETGRSGMITFRLRAESDTAQGDVIMTFRPSDVSGVNTGGDAARTMMPSSQIITIRFVMAKGDEVVGVLDPYPDPLCGCSLVTRFQGRLTGDEIKGKFETRSAEIFHRPTTGQWSVRRIVVKATTGSDFPPEARKP